MQCVRPLASGARADVVEEDPDLVTLKISLLGDQHTGKTSFMVYGFATLNRVLIFEELVPLVDFLFFLFFLVDEVFG